MVPLFYIASQKPKLSLNSQQFGLILLRGGYRSWFLSFSDGQDIHGRSVVIADDQKSLRTGYRLIPKYNHFDMRSFLRLHPEALQAPK